MNFVNGMDTNFAIAIFIVLMLFAWTDYFRFIILVSPGYAAMAGFFLGNLDGIVYAAPTGLIFLLFAYLMGSNREKAATLVFLLSIPVAVVNSRHYPLASPIAWAIVGLMAGLIENAVIEEMADGDVFIVALYFMALGPFAFIPLAFQNFIGLAFYSKQVERGYAYPVGPAMFVIAVPIFILLEHFVSSNGLPDWLLYAHFHGIPHPRLAIISAFAGYFIIPLFSQSIPEIEKESGEQLTLPGLVMGAVAGLIGGITSMALVAMAGMYVEKLGYKNLATLLAFLALAAFLFGGLVAMAFSLRLHYEGKSSIDPFLWFWGLELAAIVLSLYLIPSAWRAFPDARTLAPAFGAIITLWSYVVMRKEMSLDELSGPWKGALLTSAFLAGLWAGFGIGGIVP